ncbi:MAG: right-handed parallel beta-helix repeat-containing protein [Actinomycetota bacterium]|nr:right-handed parallel beta-helix repeat-containing protein [Actinomycetota bacterium]
MWPFIVIAVAAVLVGAFLFSRGRGAEDDGPEIISVPNSISADCSRNVEVDLNAFIAKVPDESIVRFARDGCYAQAARIEVHGTRNVTFDGNGSTFRSSAANVETVQPNWFVVDATDTTFQGVVVEGNFKEFGSRSAERVGQIARNQFNAGFFIYGGLRVVVRDSTIRDTFGDGVGVAPAGILPGGRGATVGAAHDIRLQRLNISHTARQAVAFTGGVGLWLEDSTISDAWYWGVDAEIDAPGEGLKDVHILRNVFDGMYFGAITVPAPGRTGDVDGIEIRGNRTLTGPDVCGNTVLVTYWQNTGSTMANIVVEDNQFKAKGPGVEYRDVSTGSVRNNTIELLPGCGVAPPVRPINSPNVVLCGNVATGLYSPNDPSTAPCADGPTASGPVRSGG